MRCRQIAGAALAAALLPVAGCCRVSSAPRLAAAASVQGPTTPTPDAVRDASTDSITEIAFRRVDFHIASGLVLGIRRLRGEMVSTTPGRPVVFDDKRSFVLRLVSAEVAIDTASLGVLMNRYVFGYDGAPLRGLRFSTAGRALRLSGVLHKVVGIPFELTSTVSVTDGGMIRVHPTAMQLCSIPGKGRMNALGIQLDDLLDLRKARGARVDGNDLLLDPDRLLPPPAIRGRLTGVRVEPGHLVQTFGTEAAAARLPPITPPDTSAPNYMFFRHGTLRFGKLFMVRADLQIVDLAPATPFAFSIDRYNEQLVAGYSKNLPDLGLQVFMPDFGAVSSRAEPTDTAMRCGTPRGEQRV